jgi:hypothetical protein
MNFKFDSLAYAKALLLLEEQRNLLQSRFVLAATNGEKKLLSRVKRLFNHQQESNFSIFRILKLGVVCLTLLLVFFSAVPFLSNSKAKSNAFGERKNEPKLPIVLKKPTTENAIFHIINIPVNRDRNNNLKPTKKKAKDMPTTVPVEDLVNAYINEDLLNIPIQDEAIPSQIVENALPRINYLVKIEYQQSGKKQVTVYYFELKNNDGITALKPLVVLNKYKAKAKKSTPQLPLNTLDSIAKPVKKKGITT